MVVRSQNGYTANDRSLIRSALVAGTDVRLAVRTGPAGDLLLEAAARWHREVEPLRGPDGVLDCWGYAERLIRGSATTVSNHASGTGTDLRARAHPLGKVNTFTPAQRAAIRRILDDCGGCVRWGGDYSGRKDEMHLEIVDDEAVCAQVLERLAAPPAARPGPASTAAAHPLPAPALPVEEDDLMHVTIQPDPTGAFRTTVMAEVGAGSATGYRQGWLTLGSTWGDTDFVVTALGGDGAVLDQFTAGRDDHGRIVPIRVGNNRQVPLQLPDGTRQVTVEGAVAHLGAIPAAAIWHVR